MVVKGLVGLAPGRWVPRSPKLRFCNTLKYRSCQRVLGESRTRLSRFTWQSGLRLSDLCRHAKGKDCLNVISTLYFFFFVWLVESWSMAHGDPEASGLYGYFLSLLWLIGGVGQCMKWVIDSLHLADKAWKSEVQWFFEQFSKECL